jgi:hypothetical protein
LFAAMTTIRAMARSRPFKAGAGCDFEIPYTCFDRTFPTDVALFVGLNRDTNSVPEPF